MALSDVAPSCSCAPPRHYRDPNSSRRVRCFSHIFERFYRAKESRSRQVDGAGLGLSLAREIARAHRGDLFLDTTGDSLTSFVLVLPRA